MKKNISILILMLTSLFLCSLAFAEYKPGTYKGSSIGKKTRKQSGLVEVEVTVSTNKIEKITVLTYEQSVKNRKYGPLVNQAEKEIPAAILAKQSLHVDVVANATLSSTALQLAVANALHKATSTYNPGTYKGTANTGGGKNMR